MTDTEWDKIRKTIRELWPEWKPAEAQRREFEHRLKSRQADTVENAIRDHFALDESFKTPTLARIIGRCKAAVESRHAAPRNRKADNGTVKNLPWRAMWTENGHTVVSGQHFGSKQSVIYTHGNSVTPLMLGKDANEDISEQESDRDDAIALECIQSWTPERRANAIAVAVAAGCIQDIVRHDPEAWTRHERGFITAADWLTGTQPNRVMKMLDRHAQGGVK